MQRYSSTRCTRCQNTSYQQVRSRNGWTACVLVQTLSPQPAEPGTAEADRMGCHAAESLQLSGMYLRAFEKMFNVLEDSGWALKRGDDSDASSSDDDDFQPLLGM